MALALSKLPVGSSAKTKDGLLIKALATATLCCSPPERLCGFLSFLSASPIKSKSSNAFLFTSFAGRLPIQAGTQTFSIAVNSGNK